jgi:hypothetical protein
VPALVTFTGVAVADQLLGDPTTIATWAGAGPGMVAFASIWLVARRAMRVPVLPRLTEAIAVTVVVAAFVGVSTVTRVQDEHNYVISLNPAAVLTDPSPLSAGFHTLAAQKVPAVHAMVVSCADASDCVATGVGTYPGAPPPFWTFAMVGASSDGGRSWSVKALPLRVLASLPATCGDLWCTVPLVMASGPGRALKVTFGRRGAPARFVYLATTPLPGGNAGTPQCHGNNCIAFGELKVPSAPAEVARGPSPAAQRVGEPHGIAVAWYSADGGSRWAMTILPQARALTGSSALVALSTFGPWCSSGSYCTGELTKVTGNCDYATHPPKCTGRRRCSSPPMEAGSGPLTSFPARCGTCSTCTARQARTARPLSLMDG